MQRSPIDQYLKDPDKKARIFVFMTYAMILTTILITVGTLMFILFLVGVF
ncbi:hypothetical protein [Methanobrevibacter sp. DSM 116169]